MEGTGWRAPTLPGSGGAFLLGQWALTGSDALMRVCDKTLWLPQDGGEAGVRATEQGGRPVLRSGTPRAESPVSLGGITLNFTNQPPKAR